MCMLHVTVGGEAPELIMSFALRRTLLQTLRADGLLNRFEAGLSASVLKDRKSTSTFLFLF